MTSASEKKELKKVMCLSLDCALDSGELLRYVEESRARSAFSRRKKRELGKEDFLKRPSTVRVLHLLSVALLTKRKLSVWTDCKRSQAARDSFILAQVMLH